MKNYIWLNPVVSVAYEGSSLIHFLSEMGFEVVQPNCDHVSTVRKEYRDLLDRSENIVLDQRCPKITESFHSMNVNVVFHDIDPILIHVAKELANREDLKDGYKWIITPCVALKNLGNRLCLEDTIFLTWDDFKQYLKINLLGRELENSPIPFGFFNSIEKNTIYVSQESMHPLHLQGVKLIEGLYCKNGCHNGDGVQCLSKQKS